jgi:hypothetical protein
MKKRLHDKKAGIAILAALFIISLADVILRAITFGNMIATSANHGEVFMTAILSLLLIVFALKGKDRIFHILCGVLLGFFVLEQFMGLPYIVSSLFTVWGLFASIVPVIALVSRLLGMICIIVIGALLLEYMNDGTICNKAFNVFCITAVLMLAISTIIDIYSSIITGDAHIVISALDTISSITMVFLCTFFAYDSAKAQLKKTNLTK